jgi:hypothetical protein
MKDTVKSLCKNLHSCIKIFGNAGHYRSFVRFVLDTEIVFERVGVRVVDLLRETEMV